MAIDLSSAAETAAINAACDAIVDLLDAGSTAGHIRLTLNDGTTEVATCIGQDPFFGSATGGVATQSGSAVDSAATGSASAVTKFQARDSDNTMVFNGTVVPVGGSGDLEVDDGRADVDVVIDTNAVVTISSCTFTISFS